MRLPKVPTHKPLYTKKLDIKTMEKIDSLVQKLDVSKWMVVDSILSTALGIKTKNPIDITKYLK